MEWILNRPPRIGLKVYFESTENGHPSAGVYRVVENDEYDMAGHVVIEASNGSRYGANAEQMEILEHHPDFLEMAVPKSSDGLVFLPDEATLRANGFTDRRLTDWYYTARIGSGESFEVIIPKEPVGFVLGEPVYGYTESVMDESFGQHAYFGRMKNDFRYPLAKSLSEKLAVLLALGLKIQVNPANYGWEDWPKRRPLIGLSSDRETLEFLRQGK